VRPVVVQPGAWQTAANASLQITGAPRPAPAVVRGVSAEPPAVKKFLMPSPEALGITAAVPAVIPTAAINWGQIQTCMERLGVLQYKKTPIANGVRVSMLLPTSSPGIGQPVEAQAETEAGAIVMALDAAEEWSRRK
jgi:hypothetical protein